MSPNYSLLPSSSRHQENSSIRRLSNLSSLYLEKSSFAISETGKSSGPEKQERRIPGPKRYDEDVEINLVKVAVLGDSGVGKTALLETFVESSFPSQHIQTRERKEYHPSLILDNSIYELKVLDLPVICQFPANTEQEWEHYRFLGLRRVHAYILVFDIASNQSFQFISNLRDQMLQSRDDISHVPIIVVANKSDLIPTFTPEQLRFRQETSSQIRKTWKLHYVECSAKHNYNISSTFKLLAQELKIVKEIENGEKTSRNQSRGCSRGCCFKCLPSP